MARQVMSKLCAKYGTFCTFLRLRICLPAWIRLVDTCNAGLV